MNKRLSKTIDQLSTFFAHRKGLLPLIGILFILLNFFLTTIGSSWIAQVDLLLHLGIIIAILGFMLAWAL